MAECTHVIPTMTSKTLLYYVVYGQEQNAIDTF